MDNKTFNFSFKYDAKIVEAVKTLPTPTRKWNPTEKVWTVDCGRIFDLAKSISKINSSLAKELLEGEKYETARKGAEKYQEVIKESRASDSNEVLPVPAGLYYFGYQKAGISFSAQRPVTLIADEMGLGKTIQAIGLINKETWIKKILVICPASLRLNWRKELNRWLIEKRSIGVVVGGKDVFPNDDIVIINYDVLKKYHDAIRSVQWDLIIGDEVHLLKNPKAQRTVEVYGKWDRDPAKVVEPLRAKKVVLMTGTPLVNRPVELWGLLHYASPDKWRSWKYYTNRYCEAHHNGYGWDFSGAQNLEELQEILRSTIMIRRLKADVLTDLPAKIRQVIELPQNGCASVVQKEKDAWDAKQEYLDELRAAVEIAKTLDDDASYRDAVKKLNEAMLVAFSEMSAVRHETALAKVPYMVEYLKEALEDGHKIVVFGHHRDVLENLFNEFKDISVLFYGGMNINTKDDAVTRFQNDPNCKLFLGSILASGVGITLTAASHAVFVELDWVPGNMSQAEDRLHRIGQTNSVFIQHFVLEGSLDAKMAHDMVEKQENIDKAMNNHFEDQMTKAADVNLTECQKTSKKGIEVIAERLTDIQVVAIYNALRTLSGMCDGARNLDDYGFNKIDTFIGKDLALRSSLTKKQAALGYLLVRKYHRQYSKELFDVIYSTQETK